MCTINGGGGLTEPIFAHKPNYIRGHRLMERHRALSRQFQRGDLEPLVLTNVFIPEQERHHDLNSMLG